MKGITFYLKELETALKFASDEELGRYLRITLEAAKNETIPTMENERDEILFDGFKRCLERSLKSVEGKRAGGKKNSKRNKDAETQKINSEYRKLLKDDRWKSKRAEIIKRDKCTCQMCHQTLSRGKLNVHHTEYHKVNGKLVDPWDYPNNMLITLCTKCHKKWHNDNNYKIIEIV